MNDHFTVTIHDDNGVKQFNIHKIVKKAILYALAFIGIVSLTAIGTILYLNHSVDNIEKKRLEIQSSYINLLQKNEDLAFSIKKSQSELDKKNLELSKVSDSLTKIEEMIGLSESTDIELKDRITNTKLTSQQRLTLLQLIPSGSPIKYLGLTSKFGWRTHPITNKREFHKGDDLKAKMKTPVYATADSIVEWAGKHKKSGYGNLVILDHAFGFKTLFGHLNKIVVKSGQYVKKGDLIAYTGTTGMSNGPHLHYEIRFISRALNPFWFIKWNLQNYNNIFTKETKVPWQSLITAATQLKAIHPTQTPLSLPMAQK